MSTQNPSKTPLYIERSHEQAFAPPFLQGDCRLYGFPIRASRTQIQAVCDRFLNTPARGAVHYRAAAGLVFVYFSRFGCTRSYAGADGMRGFLGENEFGIWLPIERTLGGESSSSSGPWLFPHLMLVDSGPAMITGREVYGFPKELGHITLPDSPDDLEFFAADALIFPRHRPATAGRFGRLVEVRRTRTATSRSHTERLRAATGALTDLAELIMGQPSAEVAANMSPTDRLTGFIDSALRIGRGQTSFVLLKQFRDCRDPQKAAYQAIVEARTRLWKLSNFALLPDTYTMSLTDCDSFPLAKDLGLTPESLTDLRGIAVEMSFDLEPADVVWCSP